MTDPTIPYDSTRGSWRQRLAALLPVAGSARLHVIDGPDGRTITNLIRTADNRPARPADPGSGMITAGMVLLGLLDAGLLYVVFAAQDRFVFNVKHQSAAAVIQALALDTAMIIFSVLGLGLARKGLPAPVERALIVACAAASAFMNWTAADRASFRSVAVYVAAPVLLAVTTDRTISVVRRHVLGMRDDGSVWARLGRRLGAGLLYVLRLVVDFRATRAGIRQAILRAAPLPGLDQPVTPGPGVASLERNAMLTSLAALQDELAAARAEHMQDGLAARQLAQELAARLSRLELGAAASGNGHAVYPSKKAHLLALYRDHPGHGRREVASRVAAGLAGPAGLQPGTARAYVYEELARLAGDTGAAGTPTGTGEAGT